ncbi:hypothetical protein, partial [Serratia marcescens]|uniref:hypothetical protein n=1 Tax=Serratia marcescens TaxID=615 RepID=UPI00197F70DB
EQGIDGDRFSCLSPANPTPYSPAHRCEAIRFDVRSSDAKKKRLAVWRIGALMGAVMCGFLYCPVFFIQLCEYLLI